MAAGAACVPPWNDGLTEVEEPLLLGPFTNADVRKGRRPGVTDRCCHRETSDLNPYRTADEGRGFNRSMQPFGEIAQSVCRSLVFSGDAR
jgi:hypothetical protein